MRSICHPSGFMYRCSALPVLPHWLGRMISADITMYSLVAGSGELFCMPQVMGVYRKHDASVTASEEHRGSLYHRRRIILWLHSDRHYISRFRLLSATLPAPLVAHSSRQSVPPGETCMGNDPRRSRLVPHEAVLYHGSAEGSAYRHGRRYSKSPTFRQYRNKAFVSGGLILLHVRTAHCIRHAEHEPMERNVRHRPIERFKACCTRTYDGFCRAEQAQVARY